MLKKHIPNIITLANLLCGCIATILAVQDNLVTAALFVFLGIFFDFFDGLSARLLKVESEIGLQLDSLADMVTSGLVPGIVMFQLLQKPGSNQNVWGSPEFIHIDFAPLALVGLLVSLASGYRLAKFNIDDRQTSSFIGLPTPANALLVLSLPLILTFQPHTWAISIILNPYFLVALTLLSCYLLNAEIKLFALKFKNWSFRNNWFRYVFLIVTLTLLITFQFLALPIIIIGYILFSIALNLFRK